MMKRIMFLLITIILLSACASSQTETPPTETSVPATPIPNPYAEDAFIAFCKSAVEGNLENALQLVTEDIEIIFTGPEYVSYRATHEGYSGVEELLNIFTEDERFDCTVRRFEFNGDEVNLWWTHSSPYGGNTVYASCECNATMKGDKIHRIVNDCIYEFWPKGTN